MQERSAAWSSYGCRATSTGSTCLIPRSVLPGSVSPGTRDGSGSRCSSTAELPGARRPPGSRLRVMTTPRDRRRLAASLVLLALVGATFVAPSAHAGARADRRVTTDEIARHMLSLVNRSRAIAGSGAAHERSLRREALRHSRQMATSGSITHTPNLAELVRSLGGSVFGEDLGKGRGLQGIRNAWIRRADTRRILLDPRFRTRRLGGRPRRRLLLGHAAKPSTDVRAERQSRYPSRVRTCLSATVNWARSVTPSTERFRMKRCKRSSASARRTKNASTASSTGISGASVITFSTS